MEQMIIDLLQSDTEEMRLNNLSNGRVLIRYQGEWQVRATKGRQWRRSLIGTQDLATALKWLKGEENE